MLVMFVKDFRRERIVHGKDWRYYWEDPGYAENVALQYYVEDPV